MDDQEAHVLIADLERAKGAESTYRPIVEALIADLMERSYRSEDPQEKVRLAALEMRARLVREKWRADGVN